MKRKNLIEDAWQKATQKERLEFLKSFKLFRIEDERRK